MTAPVSVPEETSLDLLIVRTLKQLSAHLSTELAVVALTGLPLPAPPSTAFHYAASELEVEQIVTNSDVACFVFQAGPSSFMEPVSQDPALYTVNQQVSITVTVVFNMAQYTPFTMFGKTCSDSDIQSRRAARYNGAVARVMRTKLRGDAAIINVEKTDDAFGEYTLSDEQTPVKYATSTWLITQVTLVPIGCEEV